MEDVLRKLSSFLCTSLERGENHEPPRFCVEGGKLAVLRLHHGATLQNAIETTADLHYKTVHFNR